MSLARSGSAPRDGSSGSAGGHSRPSSAEPSDPLFANLDPSLHPATLNSVSSDSQNPLTSFAQHVLDDGRNELFGGLNVGGDDGSLLMGEARLDTLLEAAHKSERELEESAAAAAAAAAADNDHGDFTFENSAHNLSNEPADAAMSEDNSDQNGMRMGRTIGRAKRRREDEDIVVGPVENGDPIDPIKMKKDSHVGNNPS